MRATVGDETPVWQGGQQVGSVHRPDNRLLQFLLKAHKPEIYARPRRTAAATRPACPTSPSRLTAAEARMAALGKALPPLPKKRRPP